MFLQHNFKLCVTNLQNNHVATYDKKAQKGLKSQLFHLGDGRSRSCQKVIYFCRIVTMDIWHTFNILAYQD